DDGVRLNDHGLRTSIYRVRVLGGSLVVIVAIATVVFVLRGEGVTLTTFAATDKTEEERKQLLDYYNSISGSIGSLVSKPIELFLALIVPVAFLCVATDFTLDRARSSTGAWQYLPVLAGAALAYLFSNSLNAVNVQITFGDVTQRISANDLGLVTNLTDDQPLLPTMSLSTAWNRSFAENTSGNSVLNTILRTKLLPVEVVNARCTSQGGYIASAGAYSQPQVTFGFQSQPWQVNVLPNALPPAASLKISMSINASATKSVASQLPRGATLPMSVNTASNLVLFAAHLLPDLVPVFAATATLDPTTLAEKLRPENLSRWDIRVADLYDLPTTKTSVDESVTSNSVRGFLDASHVLWKNVFFNASDIAVKDASVEFSRTNISDSISYDAVTIAFQTTSERFRLGGTDLDFYNEEREATGIYHSHYTRSNCNHDGCELEPPNAGIQPRVQVLGLCVNDDDSEDVVVFYDKSNNNGGGRHSESTRVMYRTACNRTSESALLVVSVGKRVEGDLWNRTVTSSTKVGVIDLMNMRMVYSVTIARLKWTTENLARTFGAECDIAEGCGGLKLKMRPNEDASDYIVVGKRALKQTQLSHFEAVFLNHIKWTYLVSVNPGSGLQGYDIALPRRFSRVTAGGAALQTVTNAECNLNVDNFVNHVEKNHLYIEQSMQVGYTAAVYYLFQNAVRIKPSMQSPAVGNATAVSSTTAAALSTARRFEFAGNLQRMKVQVSIPTANVIVSLVGCALLLATSLAIVVLANRAKLELESRANAEIVTEAMINDGKYPPLLLQMTFEQVAAKCTELGASASTRTGTMNVSENLQIPLPELRVESVVLQHESDARISLHVGSEL
ncbi:hypothetical protein PybrP1_012640, partial [[Pythium] brassicae (nom. inval.)]